MSFHKVRLVTFGTLMLCMVLFMLVYGLDYYRLDTADRLFHARHPELRPSGSIGAKLGMLGVALLLCLYAYPVRKRWKWLQRFGKTKHWLDFHILLGISVPAVITLHSSFKFKGIAGVAYWLMIAVMLSGFVGRYIYAQIPKSLNETALSLEEIETLFRSLRGEVASQPVLASFGVMNERRSPEAFEVEEMSMPGVLAAMLWGDITRPFQAAALRRGAARSFGAQVRTLGGLLSSGDRELEDAIRLVRRQSRLAAKLAFLGRANQMFQLWHVVHRPFSYSFAVLACLHVTLVVLMGYF